MREIPYFVGLNFAVARDTILGGENFDIARDTIFCVEGILRLREILYIVRLDFAIARDAIFCRQSPRHCERCHILQAKPIVR